jgi:hypothetical protein
MRRLFGVTGIAIAMLMRVGLGPAAAHVSYCDLSPGNCYYAGDARRYYMAPGSRLERAYKAGKVDLRYLVERRRRQRTCALHAANGYCRVDPVPLNGR